MNEKLLQIIYTIVVIVQTILHILGAVGILLGVIALLYKNFSRGTELIIGGVFFIALKYIIGLIFLPFLKQKEKSEDYPKIPIGKDEKGNQYDIEMAHIKILGETGSGKSNLLHNIITFLVSEYSPNEVRLILSDQKRVEFNNYEKLPHLLCPPLKNINKELSAIKWLVDEMEERFKSLEKEGAMDIVEYNKKSNEKIPVIFYIIDEVFDLLKGDKKAVISENMINLLQMCRGVGIYFIVSTSCMADDVYISLPMANITTELIFKLPDEKYYKKFLGDKIKERPEKKGEALYFNYEKWKPIKLFIPLLDKDKKDSIISNIKLNCDIGYPDDELYEEAEKLVIREGKASAALLQRYLKIGFARSARLLDMLEENGIVGPTQGEKPRDVYAQEEKG